MNRKQYLLAIVALFVGSMFGAAITTGVLRPNQAFAAPKKAGGSISQVLRTRELQLVGPGNIVMARLYVDEPKPRLAKPVGVHTTGKKAGQSMASGRPIVPLTMKYRQKNSKPYLAFYKPNGAVLKIIPSAPNWGKKTSSK